MESDVPEERRLARVLKAYEKDLTEIELDLLSRFCIFRFGVTAEMLFEVFSGSDKPGQISGSLKDLPFSSFVGLVSRLEKLHLILPEQEGRFTAHPAIRDYFYRRFTNKQAAHQVVGIAFGDLAATTALDEWEDLSRRAIALGHVLLRTEAERSRPTLISRLFGVTTRKKEDDSLSREREESRRKMAREIKLFLERRSEKLLPDAAQAIREFSESCQTGRSHAPPRLTLAAAKLRLNEDSTNLSSQPGVGLPSDSASLDLLEEVIYHAISAQRFEEAYRIYSARMGGREHLGKRIGEYSRGVRILKSFPRCPEELDLAWYLRAVGDLSESYSLLIKVRPIWAGAVVCLQGRLPRMIHEKIGWPQSRVIAEFLTGATGGTLKQDRFGWGEALLGADLYLLKGDLDKAESLATADAKQAQGDWGYVPDGMRARMILAEIDRRRGLLDAAEEKMKEVESWVLRSSSVEHLCFFHAIRFRILFDQGQFESAEVELKEGLHLAMGCGFALATIDLWIQTGQFLLARAKGAETRQDAASLLEEAEAAARAALNGVARESNLAAESPQLPLDDLLILGARHPECQYAWGELEAVRLQAEVLRELGRPDEARVCELEVRRLEEKLGLSERKG